MKKTQWIDILRLIRSTKGFFVTMVVVTALGITAYMGISFATTSLINSCDDYYDENNFYDIQLGSIYGFSDEFLSELRSDERVGLAEDAYMTQSLIRIGHDDYVAEFYTQPGEINKVKLQHGRLPVGEAECAVEEALLERFSLKIGDQIVLSDASDTLKERTFTIVGSLNLVTVFATNDFYNRGISELGDGQVTTKILVDEAAFADASFKQVCYVTLNNQSRRGSEEYLALAQSVLDEFSERLEASGNTQRQAIYDESDSQISDAAAELTEGKQALEEAGTQLTELEGELSDKTAELEDQKQKLSDAKQQAQEGQEQIEAYEQELTDARTELDAAKAELDENKAKLDAAKSELDDGEAKLTSAHSQLSSAKKELNSAKSQLNSAKSSLDTYKNQLSQASAALDSEKAWLDQQSSTLSQRKSALDAKAAQLASMDPSSEEYASAQSSYQQTLASYENAQSNYDSALSSYNQQKSAYNSAKSAYDSAYSQYQSELAQYNQSESEYAAANSSYTAAKEKYDEQEALYESSLAEYEAAYATYEESEAQYQESLAELEAKKQELEEAREQISSGEAELADAEQQLSDGAGQIADKKTELAAKTEELSSAEASIETARQELDSLPESRSFSANINANASYFYFSQITEGTNAIVASMCVLLFAIAILVCFTTISRMVTEQHRFIGTQKALGFRNGEIYRKYILYVLLCTICGIILGILLAYNVIEQIVYYVVYGEEFILREFTPIIEWGDVLVLSAVEMAVMCLSAFLACYTMMRKNAIALLSSEMREEKHRMKKKGSRFPIALSMVLRNLSSNPKILLTTLISVMGCTVMMISVLTVRQSMAGIAPRQYQELQHYCGTLTLKDAEVASGEQTLAEYIQTVEDVEFLPVYEKYISYQATDGSVQYASLIGLNQETDPSPFLEILDAETLERLSVPNDGVLINLKMAENYGYQVGDAFILLDSYGCAYETTVKGIFDRNIGMAIITTPTYYASLMGREAKLYQYYVKGSNESVAAFMIKARQFPDYCSYADGKYYEDEMEYKVTSVNSIVAVLLVASALLSLFVLYNLAQMNIRKKEKDIVVMKVIGFPEKEVNGYVFWEAMVMCMIGLILGMIVGGPVGSYLSFAIEQPTLKDIRGMSPLAIALGGAVNFLIYTVINLLSLRGVQKIKLTGSAREA